MKKLFLTVAILFFSIASFSQVVQKTLNKKKIGPLTCKYKMEYKNGQDTTYFIYCNFRDLEYRYITVTGTVLIPNIIQRNELVNNLKQCFPYTKKKSDAFNIGIFTVFDWTRKIQVSTDCQYVYISKRVAIKWINWMESFNKLNRTD